MDTADILRRVEQERQLIHDDCVTRDHDDPDDTILQDERAELLQVIDALRASIEEDLTAR